MKIVYVSIGNSDDKLSQAKWTEFIEEIDEAIGDANQERFGTWFSESRSKYQNACFGFSLATTREEEPFFDQIQYDLKRELRRICQFYQQDSIAWVEAKKTKFIKAKNKSA